MARRAVLGVWALAVAVIISAFALAVAPHARAQGRSRAPKSPPRTDERAASSSAGPAPSPPSPPDNPPGPAPAPPSETAADGGGLSPLNPAANEFSDAGTTPASPADYDRLLSDIASLRARVAAVSDILFHSRIAITLQAEAERGRLVGLSVSLDDGVVWSSSPASEAADAVTVFDHAVAPGHHSVGVEVDRRDDEKGAFRSTQRTRFVVEVPLDQRLVVDLRLSDDSNIGTQFRSDKKGRYELRVRADVRAQTLGR